MCVTCLNLHFTFLSQHSYMYWQNDGESKDYYQCPQYYPSDLAICFFKLSHAKHPKIGTITTHQTSSTTPKLAFCEAQHKAE